MTMVNAGIDLVWQTPRRLWVHGQCWFMLFMGLWCLLLISIFGGAMCRMEALMAAGGQRCGLWRLHYATSRFINFYSAVLIPLVMAAGLSGVLLVIGLHMNVPVLNILVSVFYGLSLLMGLGIVLLLFAYAAAGGMLIPAVAVENCDGGDAMQRAFSYMVTRPLHLILSSDVFGQGGLILVLAVVNAALSTTAGLQGFWTELTMDGAGGAIEIFSSIENQQVLFWWGSATGWFIDSGMPVLLVLSWVLIISVAWTRIYLLRGVPVTVWRRTRSGIRD